LGLVPVRQPEEDIRTHTQTHTHYQTCLIQAATPRWCYFWFQTHICQHRCVSATLLSVGVCVRCRAAARRVGHGRWTRRPRPPSSSSPPVFVTSPRATWAWGGCFHSHILSFCLSFFFLPECKERRVCPHFWCLLVSGLFLRASWRRQRAGPLLLHSLLSSLRTYGTLHNPHGARSDTMWSQLRHKVLVRSHRFSPQFISSTADPQSRPPRAATRRETPDTLQRQLLLHWCSTCQCTRRHSCRQPTSTHTHTHTHAPDNFYCEKKMNNKLFQTPVAEILIIYINIIFCYILYFSNIFLYIKR